MSGVGAAAGVAAGLIGDIPGHPGGIMLVADSWRAAAKQAGEAAELSGRARTAVPSWDGMAAQAFVARAGELEVGLDGAAAALEAGAGVLEEYSEVLARGKDAVLALREQASAVVLSCVGDPVGAVAGAAALAAISRAYLNVLMEIRLAAANAAGALAGIMAGPDADTSAGSGDGQPPWWMFWRRADEKTKKKVELSPSDIERIKRQADGSATWDPARQGGIGDCYFLAALQAFSLTEDGQRLMRDNVTWDETKGAFVVTFYDNGRPVQVEVRDYYGDGVVGAPSLIHVYERAYGIYVKDYNLSGGHARDAMEDISGQRAKRIETKGWSLWGDDHKYAQDEWDEIERALEEGKPVAAATSGGDFSGGDAVRAVADTNDNGRIDAGDQAGDYRIVGGEYDGNDGKDNHAYTVVAIDEEYVTLRNPWGINDTAPGYSAPSGDRPDGLIRISRQDYEKYFAVTDIGG